MTTVAVQQNVIQLPLGDVVPSLTNRPINDADVKEMAASINKHGVLQAIVVRPMKKGAKGSYEIVLGEKRWRGSIEAKKETIPAVVKNYSDEEAQVAQIVENLQRSNPGPLDEARLYENLRKLMGKDATVAQIAAQVGKDESYIAQRLKLNDLTDEGKKALSSGIMGVGHAVLIAPLLPEQQNICVKWLGYEERLEGNWGPSVPSIHSITALRSFITQSFMLKLKDAPFDTADPKLNPKMGSCLSCPHNTATNAGLFPDMKEARCTFIACFFGKRDATLALKIAAVEKETGKKPYLLAVGSSHENQGPAKVKVDGYLARESYQSGPRYVKKGDECKTSRTAVLVWKGRDIQVKAEIGDTATICTAENCPKHAKQRSSVDDSTRSGRIPLKGMAFVDHKAGNLSKSLPERLRFAVFKAVADILLKETPPLANNATWTERMEQLSIWAFEQIGHDQKRDAVKALGLWPKEKKSSEMDFGQTLTDHFSGKPWALSMGVLAIQDIRNPYHPHGEAKGRSYAGEPKNQEHGIFFLAKSYHVDVGKLYDGLKSEDKAVVGKMTANVKAREAVKPKPKKAVVPKGTKVDQSGPKGTKAVKKTKKAK